MLKEHVQQHDCAQHAMQNWKKLEFYLSFLREHLLIDAIER